MSYSDAVSSVLLDANDSVALKRQQRQIWDASMLPIKAGEIFSLVCFNYLPSILANFARMTEGDRFIFKR